MNQVEIFMDNDSMDLEISLNHYLSDTIKSYDNFRLIDIKFSSFCDNEANYYSAMVIYTVRE